jgi:hypothetical protein
MSSDPKQLFLKADNFIFKTSRHETSPLRYMFDVLHMYHVHFHLKMWKGQLVKMKLFMLVVMNSFKYFIVVMCYIKTAS